MLSQTSLHVSMGDLVTGVQQVYELILEGRSTSKISSSKDVLVEIAQVVQECSQFVIKDSETEKFCASVTLVTSSLSYLLSFRRVSSRESVPDSN